MDDQTNSQDGLAEALEESEFPTSAAELNSKLEQTGVARKEYSFLEMIPGDTVLDTKAQVISLREQIGDESLTVREPESLSEDYEDTI